MDKSEIDLIRTTANTTATAPRVPASSAASPSHLVDVTMFWSPVGGGVGRYLRNKQAWVASHAPEWRHTLLVPDAPGPGLATLPAPRLPFSHGYRFPVSRRDARRRLVHLRPDVIEVGDPYRVAWSALDAGWSADSFTV